VSISGLIGTYGVLWGIASAAAIIGDNIGYWIGDKGGYPLARRYGPKVGIDERKLKTARYLFTRYGGKVVFFGRWVSVLRGTRSTGLSALSRRELS
jgi:membrane protein DedA with SNARE-associated domain